MARVGFCPTPFEQLPWRGTSAGGGYTTVADLMKFAGALVSNKLLKAETLAEAMRLQFTTGAASDSSSEGRTRRGPTVTAAALRE